MAKRGGHSDLPQLGRSRGKTKAIWTDAAELSLTSQFYVN